MPNNRLAGEKSPYLLQHAHNPVDWYPWGEEAFSKAKAEDKPIFLSVGYATCHWCHVMERESFENAGVARILNENFVSIKVDREERPDVDRVYMLFVQASTGQGGWPMSVFLTPDRKPFFGGTYFPPDARFGRPGFAAILERLAQTWTADRERVEQSGAQVLEQLGEYTRFDSGGRLPGPEALERAFWAFRRSFDPAHAGFGRAPKFPRPSVFNFLLRYQAAANNDEALEMVTATLRAMAKGGMHDQLGGGFHRYSVDERWFVPHFEKMLYDQAQLAISYVEAFQITRDGDFAAVARDIFTYVLRDLTDAAGGFDCAEDADSATDPSDPHDKSEGAFYIWSREELTEALGEADSAVFAYRYGVRDGGNVEEDPQGEFIGRNILFEEQTLEETAAHAGVSRDDVRTALEEARSKLLAIRAKRPRPLLDDKILASWNGLMISAFAKGAQALNEPRYAAAARSAADFLKRNLWDESRRVLLRRYRQGAAAIDAFLDDYAFCGLGLLDLYETTFEAADFEWAIEIAERALALFQDAEHGGFFATHDASASAVSAEACQSGAPDLVLRLKDDYDGAEPSGNSAMALFLARLARMTGREDFRVAAERTLKAFASRIEEGAVGVPQMLVALQFVLAPPREIILAGPLDDEMLAAIRRRFLPQTVIMRTEQTGRDLPAMHGQPTAYVCENFACKLPVTDGANLAGLLR
ncbi:MAG TPA: thioredoxin domain-containing protein [Bryobacteraceae bacterium]|nr:thioredoxin domain-containing protein [Bryobacteraceae bacterium]